ncbi:MAG: MMPL family transporter [Myxococcales bacterium]|nr:MMPL family transporter [Myxococcales bacterium]
MSDERPQIRAPAERLAGLIVRRPWRILVAALVVGALALALALQLRIDQQLRALLPDDARSTARIDALSERLGNQSELYVTVRSPSREANLRFGALLADALRQRAELRYVLFHLDRELFERSALLYADLEDLLDLRCRVIERIRAEVRREMALFPEDEAEAVAAADAGLSEEELRGRYELDTRLPEYYETDEGRLVVIKARPVAPDTDIAFARQLFAEVGELAESLDPRAFHPEMTIGIEGSYAEQSRRVGGLSRDIVRGSALVVGLLMLSLALYFRGARAIALVLLPLLIAVASALGFARVVYGELNLVSAFIFVVLLGLGIDFGIHVLARLRDERRRGRELADAIAVTLSTTALSTLAGGLSTALTCFLLVVADFRGFSQFGVVAGVGVLLSLLGAIVVMPALMVILERWRPWRSHAAPARATVEPAPEARSPAPSGRGPVPWLAILVLGTGLVIGGAAASRLGDLEFEYDLGRLDQPVRPKKERPREGHEPFRDAVGRNTTLAPAVALTDDLAGTLDVHRQLAALHRLSADEVAILAGGGALPLPPAIDACGRPLAAAATGGADADADEEDDEDSMIDEEDDDLRDPAFVALAERARQHRALDPEVAGLLARYPGERLVTMHDRLHDLASVFSYVPELQEEKLAVIRDIRRRIKEKSGVLSDADQARLKSWEPYLEVDAPISAADLPEWVRVQFTDEAGVLGRFVVFWTKGAKADYRNSKKIYDAYLDIETREGPAPVAASFFVIPEIVDTIRGDGPLVIALSSGVLVLIALILFRGIGAALVILSTVALALAWLGGLLWLLGYKLNFFNVIAFPLLIGMGQDDAVHILHRFREGSRMGVVLRETGGAIFMTTLTTVLGYGGMVFADHLGLYSLGFTAASGMTLCLVASVVVLPAGLRVMSWIRGR